MRMTFLKKLRLMFRAVMRMTGMLSVAALVAVNGTATAQENAEKTAYAGVSDAELIASKVDKSKCARISPEGLYVSEEVNKTAYVGVALTIHTGHEHSLRDRYWSQIDTAPPPPDRGALGVVAVGLTATAADGSWVVHWLVREQKGLPYLPICEPNKLARPDQYPTVKFESHSFGDLKKILAEDWSKTISRRAGEYQAIPSVKDLKLGHLLLAGLGKLIDTSEAGKPTGEIERGISQSLSFTFFEANKIAAELNKIGKLQEGTQSEDVTTTFSFVPIASKRVVKADAAADKTTAGEQSETEKAAKASNEKEPEKAEEAPKHVLTIRIGKRVEEKLTAQKLKVEKAVPSYRFAGDTPDGCTEWQRVEDGNDAVLTSECVTVPTSYALEGIGFRSRKITEESDRLKDVDLFRKNVKLTMSVFRENKEGFDVIGRPSLVSVIYAPAKPTFDDDSVMPVDAGGVALPVICRAKVTDTGDFVSATSSCRLYQLPANASELVGIQGCDLKVSMELDDTVTDDLCVRLPGQDGPPTALMASSSINDPRASRASIYLAATSEKLRRSEGEVIERSLESFRTLPTQIKRLMVLGDSQILESATGYEVFDSEYGCDPQGKSKQTIFPSKGIIKLQQDVTTPAYVHAVSGGKVLSACAELKPDGSLGLAHIEPSHTGGVAILVQEAADLQDGRRSVLLKHLLKGLAASLLENEARFAIYRQEEQGQPQMAYASFWRPGEKSPLDNAIVSQRVDGLSFNQRGAQAPLSNLTEFDTQQGYQKFDRIIYLTSSVLEQFDRSNLPTLPFWRSRGLEDFTIFTNTACGNWADPDMHLADRCLPLPANDSSEAARAAANDLLGEYMKAIVAK